MSITDEVEEYIINLLRTSKAKTIEIQRSHLAIQFDCVPSQITYVLVTRFTPSRGYLVEGRRGGGGGIRISLIDSTYADITESIAELSKIDQSNAFDIILRALESGYITEREADIMQSAVHRDVLQLDLPLRDKVRAQILKAMLMALLRGGT